MERVAGIGGLFFRAQNPERLPQWYEEVLGVAGVPSAYGEDAWVQEKGETVFAGVTGSWGLCRQHVGARDPAGGGTRRRQPRSTTRGRSVTVPIAFASG